MPESRHLSSVHCFCTDIMQNFDRYPPICNRLPIWHIGRYISAVLLTDTDISVLPIWAISADISYRPIPICQPWLRACRVWAFGYAGYLGDKTLLDLGLEYSWEGFGIPSRWLWVDFTASQTYSISIGSCLSVREHPSTHPPRQFHQWRKGIGYKVCLHVRFLWSKDADHNVWPMLIFGGGGGLDVPGPPQGSQC